ncbi:MAG: hypothetical protein NTX29_10005 [Actinobacteria bacterium]|nr:hypothetical protein [Actinomycetota bacterium]
MASRLEIALSDMVDSGVSLTAAQRDSLVGLLDRLSHTVPEVAVDVSGGDQ